MKTLVLFDVGGKLYSCYLDDLSGTPAPGRWWVFDGIKYDYVDSGETLGTRGIDKRVRSGNELLLDVLKCLYTPEDAVALFAGITNVSAQDDEPETTKGGLIITLGGADATPAKFDRVLLVRVKKAKGSATGIRLMPLSKLAGGDKGEQGLTGTGRTGSRKKRSGTRSES